MLSSRVGVCARVEVTPGVCFDGEPFTYSHMEWTWRVTGIEADPQSGSGSCANFTVRSGGLGSVTFSLRATSGACEPCEKTLSISTGIQAGDIRLTVDRTWLGIDLTSEGRIDTLRATASSSAGGANQWKLAGAARARFIPDPPVSANQVAVREVGIPSASTSGEVVSVISGSCQAERNFTVVKLDIQSRVLEAEEEEPGLLIGVNDNDSDESEKPDFSESPLAEDDPDMIPLTISIAPGDLPDEDRIELAGIEHCYEDRRKMTRAAAHYPMSRIRQGLTLYVEGTIPGTYTLSARHPPSGARDQVKVAVIRVDIGMDGDRDDSIDFDDPDDAKYLFWVNDDVDVISGGEEDDAQSGTANCNDSAITCKRDLEDFTRLHIKVDDTTANLSGITYFLKFENVSSGSPSVNIFEAVGESSAYLSDTSVAAQQIQKTKLITVGTTEVQLPNQYIKTGDQVSPFILEGKTAGKGDLTIIVKKDGNEVCKKPVTLDLRPITAFYEKYVVTVSTGDDVNTTDGGNANSTTYTPETDEYVLHVHGWNMADWEKDRWTETVFKRLWWQGYKGHVGGFQWPTYTGSLTYDASELRAWRSGQALNNRITSLNASYSGQVRVLAHSMGNVVMGEALRLFSSSVVHTYIAAQAAVPAHCYDNAIGNYWTGFNTPNIYARYSSRLSPDTPYLAANSSHAGAMALYFNAQDYALGWWENNNEMKPDYAYWNTDGDSNVDSYAPASGDRFYFDNVLVPFDERTMVIPADRFEIFARIVESRSRALGRESSVSGFGTARNLQNWGYDAAHYSHSREFRSNVADEWLFWSTFFGDAGLTP